MTQSDLANAPASTVSPQGRRVLVAVVTGLAGETIQRWREQHDPEQARRLPPHTTLCYWVRSADLDRLERQVRHAFAEPVTVRLGSVAEADNEDHTFFVEVLESDTLDEARRRLYDATYLDLGSVGDWRWHISCVRYGALRELDALRRAAVDLRPESPWRIDTVALMELRGDRYEALATWSV